MINSSDNSGTNFLRCHQGGTYQVPESWVDGGVGEREVKHLSHFFENFVSGGQVRQRKVRTLGNRVPEKKIKMMLSN